MGVGSTSQLRRTAKGKGEGGEGGEGEGVRHHGTFSRSRCWIWMKVAKMPRMVHEEMSMIIIQKLSWMAGQWYLTCSTCSTRRSNTREPVPRLMVDAIARAVGAGRRRWCEDDREGTGVPDCLLRRTPVSSSACSSLACSTTQATSQARERLSFSAGRGGSWPRDQICNRRPGPRGLCMLLDMCAQGVCLSPGPRSTAGVCPFVQQRACHVARRKGGRLGRDAPAGPQRVSGRSRCLPARVPTDKPEAVRTSEDRYRRRRQRGRVVVGGGGESAILCRGSRRVLLFRVRRWTRGIGAAGR